MQARIARRGGDAQHVLALAVTPELTIKIGAFKSPVIGIGPQVGFLFPVETPLGIMQGYLNIKAYAEFDNQNRPAGGDAWVTLSFSPAPRPAAEPPLVRKY